MEAMLLQQTMNLVKARSEWLKKTGGNFNVFSIWGKNYDERAHCRLIYEFLNPNGSHGMGNLFLKEFFTCVLRKPFPDDPSVRVFREYHFSGQDTGQIDLLIKGQSFCYPIEVKIYAGDQPMQVKRYSEFASVCGGDSHIYYLTLNGDRPSEYSTGCGEISNLTCISFALDIRKWLTRCGELTWAVPAISAVIRQYINLIDKLTGYNQGDEFMEMIQNLISNSKNSYQSASAISDALTEVKIEMMRRIFSDIEAHLDGSMEKLYSDFDDEARCFYTTTRWHCPCTDYSLAKFDNKTLALEIGVDNKLFCGIYFCDEKAELICDATKNLPNMFPENSWVKLPIAFEYDNSIWFKWLPEQTPLNFKQCNDIYPDLYDKDRYNEILQQILAEIDECVSAIQKLTAE